MPPADDYVSRDEIAEVLGLTPRQITNLVKEHPDFPSRVKGRERTFPKKRCRDWYIDFKAKEQLARRTPAGSGEDGKKGTPTAIERKLLAEAIMAEIDAAAALRQTLAVDFAVDQFGRILQNLRARLSSIPTAWSPLLDECTDTVERTIKLQELVGELMPILADSVIDALRPPDPDDMDEERAA